MTCERDALGDGEHESVKTDDILVKILFFLELEGVSLPR